jgi:hypothetical protein
VTAPVVEFSLRAAYFVTYRFGDHSGPASEFERGQVRYFFNDEHAHRELLLLAQAEEWAPTFAFQKMTPEECEAHRVPHRVRVVS